MAEKTLIWYKVADAIDVIDWQPNNMVEAEVGGKKITLIRKGEQMFATAYKCPHAGGLLADGFLDAIGNLVCPLHRYKFNPANGRNVSGEGYKLKTYALEHRQGGIFVGLEENSGLNF